VNHKELGYDLKGPCADCPFRKDAKFHAGVFKDLKNLVYHIDMGDVIHTCHKTDPMSDSPEGQKYKGKLQHCGGLLSMMAKDVEIMGHPQAQAWSEGRWRAEQQDTKAPVFESFVKMIKHYLSGAQDRLEGKDG